MNRNTRAGGGGGGGGYNKQMQRKQFVSGGVEVNFTGMGSQSQPQRQYPQQQQQSNYQQQQTFQQQNNKRQQQSTPQNNQNQQSSSWQQQPQQQQQQQQPVPSNGNQNAFQPEQLQSSMAQPQQNNTPKMAAVSTPVVSAAAVAAADTIMQAVSDGGTANTLNNNASKIGSSTAVDAAAVNTSNAEIDGDVKMSHDDDNFTDDNCIELGKNTSGGMSLKRQVFMSMRKKIPLRLRRVRQNRRLRKLLVPKNALMALNEIKGNSISDFIISPAERGFAAEVFVNSIRYEGIGISKMAAKNHASEKALRDLIISKMVMKPKLETNNLKDGGGTISESQMDLDKVDDIEMKDISGNGDDEDEVPMMHLASFALHKLFSEWQSDGFDIPDFKAAATLGSTISLNQVEPPAPSKPKIRTELPANSETMHPTMLLALMRPTTSFTELGTSGQPPNILHQVSVIVDEEQFVGVAKTKKLARKSAARLACNKIFGASFPDE